MKKLAITTSLLIACLTLIGQATSPILLDVTFGGQEYQTSVDVDKEGAIAIINQLRQDLTISDEDLGLQCSDEYEILVGGELSLVPTANPVDGFWYVYLTNNGAVTVPGSQNAVALDFIWAGLKFDNMFDAQPEDVEYFIGARLK